MYIGIGTILWINRYGRTHISTNKRMRALVTDISVKIHEDYTTMPYIAMTILQEGPVESLHFYLTNETIKEFQISDKE